MRNLSLMTIPSTLSPKDSASYLATALQWADEIRAFILSKSQSAKSGCLKSDLSIVTEADTGAEMLLREKVAKTFPHHGVIGEELSSQNPDSEFQWIIDPIDGTQNFFHGIPTYGTALGLHYNGTPVCGILDHPALDVRSWASAGNGAWRNGKRIWINDIETEEIGVNDIICLSTRTMFERSKDEKIFDALAAQYRNIRIYYDVYGDSLTVNGSIAVSFNWGLRIWDLSASQVLIEEAGGAYQLIKSQPAEKGPPLLAAVFGKKKAVAAAMRFLKDRF